MSAAGVAAAQEARTYQIPSQPLVSALYEFGEQSGRQVLFKPGLADNKVSSGVSAAADQEQALAMLLKGTGLAFRKSGDVYLIEEEGGGSPQGVSAAGDVDALIVTAQKREENIQDVPIAISAFSQESLDEQKIEGGFDLMKAIPNVTFSKSNYSGYNFSIRGVGTKAVSATSDPGVAVSFNNTSLIRNRLFEQEYFDVERVEVLRGPQGTLYGRNATSGVINVVTAKPDLDAFEGRVKLEVGNYDARRFAATVNVPLIEDVMALRVAGASTQRDGYSVNLTTGNSVDGRDLWSGRASLAFRPLDRLSADLIWERFEEDDDRLRTGKQLCHRDPGPESLPGVATLDPIIRGRLSQGCMMGSLYDDGAFGAPNGLSIPFVVAGQLVTTIGYTAPRDTPGAQQVNLLQRGVDPFGGVQSRDLRAMESMYDPSYKAKADILALNLEFDLTDALSLVSQTLYNEDEVYSFQDYHRFSTVPNFRDSRGTYNTHAPFTGVYSDPSRYENVTPNGVYTDPQIGPSDRLAGFEISSSESTQFSQELRLQSAFEGPVNFSLGANYTRFKGVNEYYLFYNIVTAIAQVQYNRSDDWAGCNNGVTCLRIDPSPVENLAGDGHNYFRNHNPYKLESKALFGEVYWEATNQLKVTAGLRYTDDRKSFTPWRSQLMQSGFDYGPDAPLNQRWTEFTGRLGVDWSPELGFTDETLIYGFYSRGYKGGGANPPPAALPEGLVLAVSHPLTFKPEYVDAFEIGAKNTLMGGALLLNGSVFLYEYDDYQVSKVEDRTVVNENFDARIWGVELEGVWRPTRDLRFNATLGYLDTEIAKGERSIDIFNRTQGNPDWMVVTPWIQQTSNCILPTEMVGMFANMGIFPGESAGFSPIMAVCLGYALEGFTWYGTGFNPADHPEINNGTGFFADVGGNELPNAPNWTFNIGAQYTVQLPSGWEGTLRGDYYRQTGSYARVYNTIADRLRGWENANVSLRLERPDDALTFEIYAKNVFDETPITDAFLNSDSTGMTTNIFVLDPRLIGVSVTKGF